MEVYKNRILRLFSSLPAYISVMILVFLGLMRTTAEMDDQDLWFVYSVLIVLGCAVLTWIFNVRKVKVGIVDAAVAMLFAWYLVCYYANASIVSSELLETCLFVPLYISLRISLSSCHNIGKWLFMILCICGIAEAVIGIQQAFGARYSNHSLFNVTGTFFNPGPYGGYIAVILSLAAGYVASRYGNAQKIFQDFKNIKSIRLRNILWAAVFAAAVCAIVAIVIIIPSTMSRAAFVAIGVSITAIILSNKIIYKPIVGYVKKNKIKASIIGVVSVFIICGCVYGIYKLKKDSADGRLLMWKMATKIMFENPATGVGQGNFRGAYGDMQAKYFRSDTHSETEIKVAGCPEYGFNEYLQIGVETGIAGLLLFLFLSGMSLWQLFRVRSYYAFGLLTLLVFAFFSYPFSILPIKTIFVLFLAVAGSSSRRRRKATVGERILIGAILTGCVFTVVIITKPYTKRIEATKKWQEQRRWYSMDLYSYVTEDYPKLFPLMKENPTFMFEYGRSLYMEGRHEESLDVMIPAARLSCDPMFYNVIGNNYKALGEYDKAAEAYLKSYYIIPHRMYPLYLLGKMYAEIGDDENSAYYARRVADMTPKVESPAARDMQREMKKLLENSQK